MRDIALLMTGVLTTGQPSPQIILVHKLVQPNNSVEKSTRGQISQLVPTSQVTPPELIPANETLLPDASAPNIVCSKSLSVKVTQRSRRKIEALGERTNCLSTQVNTHNLYQALIENLFSLRLVKGISVQSKQYTPLPPKNNHSTSTGAPNYTTREQEFKTVIPLTQGSRSVLSLSSLTQAAVKTATKNFHPQQKLSTEISDKPLTVDEQDSDNSVIMKRFSKLNTPSLPSLHFGDSGIAVKILQRLLSSNGYQVPCDGAFGALTETGVKAFQRRRNLVPDGIVGDRTWDELTK